MAPSMQSQILELVTNLSNSFNELKLSLTEHIATQKAQDEKTDKMYKIIVVGNGEKPLPEEVRRLRQWVDNVNKLVWAFAVIFIGNVGFLVWQGIELLIKRTT